MANLYIVDKRRVDHTYTLDRLWIDGKNQYVSDRRFCQIDELFNISIEEDSQINDELSFGENFDLTQTFDLRYPELWNQTIQLIYELE